MPISSGWLLLLISLSVYSGLAHARGSVEKTGDVLQALIPATGLAAAVFYEEGNEGTIQFFKSLATSKVITETLKENIDKTRPDGNCCRSFPSDNAANAFLGAGFIHKRYGWEYAVPAYIGATFVGYSRVQADKHYVEDVIAGAAIGWLSSIYFTTSYKGYELSPAASNGVYGFNINRRW